MPQSPELVTVFDASAEVYRKMVEHNFINHAEVYACLHERLKDRPPFRFLDVACWTAACSAQALVGTRIARYHGIDLVAAALAEARTILGSKLTCPIHLIAADYAEALAAWTEPVDVVWIGLSLHHQRSPGKLAVMRDIARILGDNGALLIYENTNLDGEDQHGWMARFDRQREAWKEYTPPEWNAMRSHVDTYDFPETLSSWRALAAAAGFGTVEEIYRSPSDLFRMFEFRKGGPAP
jgi:SAM-dependent methyltransferase